MQDCGVSIPCGLPCSGQNDTVKYPFSESKQSPDTVRSIRFETNGQLRDRHTHVGHPQTTRVCFSGTGSLARLQGPNRRCCWDFFELGLKIIRPPRERGVSRMGCSTFLFWDMHFPGGPLAYHILLTIRHLRHPQRPTSRMTSNPQ